jgi:Fe-S cluster assembly protein SufD
VSSSLAEKPRAHAASIEAYRADFDRLIATDFQWEPEWLKRFRAQAMDTFETLGFPTMKDEDWHFTSVAPIADRVFHPAGQPAPTRIRNLIEPKFGSVQLVFLDGWFSNSASTDPDDRNTQSVSVENFNVSHAGDDPIVKAHIGSAANMTSSAFTALNSAFFNHGALIKIADNTKVESPIELIFVSSDAAVGAVHPRNLIIAGKHSEVTIIEKYVTVGSGSYFTNAVTEIIAAEGARVTHYKLQDESTNAFHVGTAQARQARSSYYESFCFSSGGDLSRTNVYTILEGDGAECVLNGLYLADGTQHMDHQTYVEHVAPNCPSHELYKGILDGRSHGVFNGKVYVHPEAQKTDGKQSNNNLLLSEHARVDTKPQLEIFADDVKCTHGATVGRLDETALFYLRSRGLGKSVARKLLTYAFAADVLERLSLEPLKQALEARVLERFTG